MSAEAAEKAGRQRFNACMNRDVTHLRVGDKRGDQTAVLLVGMAAELHGTACTCCPRREATRR